MKRHKVIVSHNQAIILIEALNQAMVDWADNATEDEWGKEYRQKIKVADNLCNRIKKMYWTLEASK